MKRATIHFKTTFIFLQVVANMDNFDRTKHGSKILFDNIIVRCKDERVWKFFKICVVCTPISLISSHITFINPFVEGI